MVRSASKLGSFADAVVIVRPSLSETSFPFDRRVAQETSSHLRKYGYVPVVLNLYSPAWPSESVKRKSKVNVIAMAQYVLSSMVLKLSL